MKDDASTQFGHPVESQQDVGYSGGYTTKESITRDKDEMRSRRIQVDAHRPNKIDPKIQAKISSARQTVEKEMLKSLARNIVTNVNGLNEQRDYTTMDDVYVAAKAFCEHYEDISR